MEQEAWHALRWSFLTLDWLVCGHARCQGCTVLDLWGARSTSVY